MRTPLRPKTYTEDYLKKVSAYSRTKLIQFMHDGIQQRGISPKIETGKEITFFDSSEKPGIAVFDYMVHLTRSLQIDSAGILSAYIYLMRYLEATQIELTDFNIHRIVATVFVITQKYLYDHYFNMKTYMDATNLPRFELARLELLFYEGINWELHINSETLTALTEHFDRYVASKYNPQNAPYTILSLELPFDLRNTQDKHVQIDRGNKIETLHSVIDTQRYRVFSGFATRKPQLEQTLALAPATAETPISTP